MRPEAVGRLRRTACVLIAAACTVAMLAAASAAAAPAYGAVLAARDTAISAAAINPGPPAPSPAPAGARGDEAGTTRSRISRGQIEIAAGVLLICFAVLAVQAARRRGR
jgi:hypothetical protein